MLVKMSFSQTPIFIPLPPGPSPIPTTPPDTQQSQDSSQSSYSHFEGPGESLVQEIEEQADTDVEDDPPDIDRQFVIELSTEEWQMLLHLVSQEVAGGSWCFTLPTAPSTSSGTVTNPTLTQSASNATPPSTDTQGRLLQRMGAHYFTRTGILAQLPRKDASVSPTPYGSGYVIISCLYFLLFNISN